MTFFAGDKSMEEMTEAEKAERERLRKLEIERRNKTRNSRIFLLVGSIFEIAETLLVIIGLFIFFSFLIFKVFNLPEEAAKTIYQYSTIVSFLGGLFLGFLLYKRCAGLVIEKFHLVD
jgi:hypothetical protein